MESTVSTSIHATWLVRYSVEETTHLLKLDPETLAKRIAPRLTPHSRDDITLCVAHLWKTLRLCRGDWEKIAGLEMSFGGGHIAVGYRNEHSSGGMLVMTEQEAMFLEDEYELDQKEGRAILSKLTNLLVTRPDLFLKDIVVEHSILDTKLPEAMPRRLRESLMTAVTRLNAPSGENAGDPPAPREPDDGSPPWQKE